MLAGLDGVDQFFNLEVLGSDYEKWKSEDYAVIKALW